MPTGSPQYNFEFRNWQVCWALKRLWSPFSAPLEAAGVQFTNGERAGREAEGEEGEEGEAMHKFYLGQSVSYRSPRSIGAPSGVYVVTAKLPERDGEFEYHIRHAREQHERMVRESELSAVEVNR